MEPGLQREAFVACVIMTVATLCAACSIDKRGRPWDPDFDAAICGPSACDDSIPCTVDDCTPGGCTHEPNNLACTTFPDGICNQTMGCIYPCNATSCFPVGNCDQSAMCVDNRCVRTPEVCP